MSQTECFLQQLLCFDLLLIVGETGQRGSGMWRRGYADMGRRGSEMWAWGDAGTVTWRRGGDGVAGEASGGVEMNKSRPTVYGTADHDRGGRRRRATD